MSNVWPSPAPRRTLAIPPVELCSGIDSLYLSAQGFAPPSLLADLEVARLQAEADGLPVEFDLGGYPVKVRPRAFGKYRYALAHELAEIGITPSENLPVARVQPTSMAIHALGPGTTVLWVENVLDAAGIVASLHVSRLDLHSDWQGVEVKAHDRSNFVTYSDKRALYEVGEEMSGLNFGKRGGKLYARIYDKSREMVDKGHDWWPDVWGDQYDPERRVTRFEFEFSRAGLTEFRIDRPADAIARRGELWAYATMPNALAPMIPRVFELRAEGRSYPEIERLTGFKYSTVRQIVHNRAYLGETQIRGTWFPGIHQPLVSPELFEAAQRGNRTGKRLGRDLLSGRVKCGNCGKRVPIERSGHAGGVYRCKSRGHACGMPGRAASGLLRASVIAMRELAQDESLQEAIRQQLAGRDVGASTARPSSAEALRKLRRKREKLLALYYDDKISAEMFAEQEGMLSRQIRLIEQQSEQARKATEQRHALADQFELVAARLRNLDIDKVWDYANERERRTLVNQAIEAVTLFPDRVVVTLTGALPITVLLSEAGLRGPGMGISVSEGGLELRNGECRLMSVGVACCLFVLVRGCFR